MDGRGHYRRAEELIAEAREAIAPQPRFTPLTPGAPTRAERHQQAITEAQVHATLALAAGHARAGQPRELRRPAHPGADDRHARRRRRLAAGLGLAFSHIGLVNAAWAISQARDGGTAGQQPSQPAVR
jgi:hypothetical protein